MSRLMRVLVADDHAVVRRGVAGVIAGEPDMLLVGEVETGAEVLTAVATLAVDVLVLDLSLPDQSGVSVLQRVRQIAPKVGIVVFTAYPEDQLALHLLKEGAGAYLNKTRPPDDLLAAIRRVGRGDRYLTETLINVEREHQLAHDEQAPHQRLTTREFTVFLALIDGKPVGRIAEELDLSGSTVSNHVAAIRDKLGAASIADVVRYAHRAGLL